MKVIKWKSVKERLGFAGIGCCGPIWSDRQSTVDPEEIADPTAENPSSPLLVRPNGQMNLAMALAAERKTMMRLIEETDGGDEMGNDWMCGVCIDRSKGAAFIPCGHAFCRVCSRELWTNRGSCPICNRPIRRILDIF